MNRKLNLLLCATCTLAVGAAAACKDNPVSSETGFATIQFTLSSPLCSQNVPWAIDFSADSVLLGTESLANKGVSKTYTLKAGRHEIGAYVQRFSVMFDTTMTFVAGQSYLRNIDFYCS